MSVYGSYPAILVNSVWEEKLMLKWNINKKSSSVFFQWQTMVIITIYTVKPVTVQGNIETWSHKTGGCLIQVKLI
jgi:hypothetical protein